MAIAGAAIKAAKPIAKEAAEKVFKSLPDFIGKIGKVGAEVGASPQTMKSIEKHLATQSASSLPKEMADIDTIFKSLGSDDIAIREAGYSSLNELDNHIRPMQEKEAIATALGKRVDSYKTPDKGVHIPEIKELEYTGPNKEVVQQLYSEAYTELDPKYQFIKPEEMVESGLLNKFIKRSKMLAAQAKKTEDMRLTRNELSAKPKEERITINPKGEEVDQLRRATKNFKTNNRSLSDLASMNLLVKDASGKDVFKIQRAPLKKALSIFGQGKMEWHHTLFGNKEAGMVFLNKVTQDPMIAVNLMALLKKLDLKTSGTIGNLSLLDEVPHNKLHNWYREFGLEQGKELDFADYIKEIATAYTEGRTDINEFFSILEVYSERVAPYMAQKTKEAGGIRFQDIKGFEKEVEGYTSKPQKQLS